MHLDSEAPLKAPDKIQESGFVPFAPGRPGIIATTEEVRRMPAGDIPHSPARRFNTSPHAAL